MKTKHFCPICERDDHNVRKTPKGDECPARVIRIRRLPEDEAFALDRFQQGLE